MAYAVGIYSKAICDRCGFRYDYLELRQEWNGLKVVDDNIPFIVFTSTGKDIIPSSIEDLNTLTGSVGTVTVSIS